MNDEPVEIIQPGERGKISGITNDSKIPMKVFATILQRDYDYDYNWTAEELEIMKRGGSVPVTVNGTIVKARMSRSLRRKAQPQLRRQI
jgi:hypothetical protein